MIDKLHLTIILTLLVSCGHESGEYPTTDPVFKPYLEELSISTITPITFQDLPQGLGAQCNIYDDGYSREILVDRTYWDTIPDSYRLVLIAHEIGHCDYNLPHVEGNQDLLIEYPSVVNTSKCPLSIMQESNWGGICWDQYKLDYLSIFD